MLRRAARRLGIASVAILAAALAAAAGGAGPDSVRVEISVHHSRFEPSSVTVPRGVPVTFVLVNRDPIDHEWLVGDADFHERHRRGTEAHHAGRPDEVSLPALGTARTTLTFEEPGRVAFICHLPGHEAYGMVGTVLVV